MPKNLMPVAAVCGDSLLDAQGHGSMLVAQEIRVSQFELEARGIERYGTDRLSPIGDARVDVFEEEVAVVREVADLVRVGFAPNEGRSSRR
jgi:hypothetical protein